jgi:hypothetical protein
VHFPPKGPGERGSHRRAGQFSAAAQTAKRKVFPNSLYLIRAYLRMDG